MTNNPSHKDHTSPDMTDRGFIVMLGIVLLMPIYMCIHVAIAYIERVVTQDAEKVAKAQSAEMLTNKSRGAANF